MKTIKLAIGIPAYGGRVAVEQAQMWLSLGDALLWRIGVIFKLVMFGNIDVCNIERARNRLVAEAMHIGADWLFMIDADTWVVPGSDSPHERAGAAILRMIEAADETEDAAIVAAPVRNRQTADAKHLAVYRRVGLGGAHVPYLSGEINCLGLTSVHAVGAACMAINLHKTNAANASFRFTDLLGEDLEFCRQMREAGHRILVDGRVKTAHLARPIALYSE